MSIKQPLILRKYSDGSYPNFNEEILAIRMPDKIGCANPISFTGYFAKDCTDRSEFLFIFNDEQAMNGEDMEIDFWIPLQELL